MTLNSIEEMNVQSDLEWELIIVDNNSIDETKELIKEYKINSRINIRYIFERKQGLSYARNRGIKKAKGRIIVFTDDDIMVEKSWL